MIMSFLFAILLVMYVIVVVVVAGAGILTITCSFIAAMAGIGELFNTDNSSKKEGLKLLLGGFSLCIVLVAAGLTAANYGLGKKIGEVQDYLYEKAKPATVQLEK